MSPGSLDGNGRLVPGGVQDVRTGGVWTLGTLTFKGQQRRRLWYTASRMALRTVPLNSHPCVVPCHHHVILALICVTGRK